MATERFEAGERHPAIEPEKLKLPDGTYANKFTLLRHMASVGLPVPEIITEARLEAHSAAGLPYDVYRRGYFDHPIDMWAVDTFPTYRVVDERTNVYAQAYFDKAKDSEELKAYLLRNFKLKSLPNVGNFLQQTQPATFFFTTLTHGKGLYASCSMPDIQNYATSLSLEDDDPITRLIGERFFKNIDPLVKKVKLEGDKALGGSFNWKIDYLYDDKRNFHIIQVRVASEVKDDERETTRITRLIENGVQIFDMELGNLRRLPSDPYILQLSNSAHIGYYDLKFIMSLDMTNMQGLLLPEGLRGGLLQHNGYIFIAYALYWGLPVVVSNQWQKYSVV